MLQAERLPLLCKISFNTLYVSILCSILAQRGRIHHHTPDAPTSVAEHLVLAPIYPLMYIQAPLLAQP